MHETIVVVCENGFSLLHGAGKARAVFTNACSEGARAGGGFENTPEGLGVEAFSNRLCAGIEQLNRYVGGERILFQPRPPQSRIEQLADIFAGCLARGRPRRRIFRLAVCSRCPPGNDSCFSIEFFSTSP